MVLLRFLVSIVRRWDGKIEIESSNYPTQYLDGDYDDGMTFDPTTEDLGDFTILSGIDVFGHIVDGDN